MLLEGVLRSIWRPFACFLMGPEHSFVSFPREFFSSLERTSSMYTHQTCVQEGLLRLCTKFTDFSVVQCCSNALTASAFARFPKNLFLLVSGSFYVRSIVFHGCPPHRFSQMSAPVFSTDVRPVVFHRCSLHCFPQMSAPTVVCGCVRCSRV